MKIISTQVPASSLPPPPQTPDSVMPFSWRMLRLSAGARPWMVLGTLVQLLTTATYVGQGVCVALALARIFDGAGWQAVTAPLLGALALIGVRAALLWTGELVATSTGAAVKSRLRRRLYAKLFALGPSYSSGARTGTVQATAVDGVEKLEAYFSRFLVQLFAAVLGSAAILLGLLAVDWVVAAVLAAAAAAISTTPLLLRRMQAERQRWFWSLWRRLGAEYLDALQGMSMLKAFGASGGHGRELSTLTWDFYRASIKFVSVANLRTGAMGLLSAGGVALAIGLGVVRLSTGAIGAFELLVILLLAREAVRPLEDLQKAYHSAYPALSAAGGIFALLDTRPQVGEPDTPAPPPRAASITFDSVSFAYGAQRPDVLREVSLHIDEGETVAVVGRSGAGKSTLVALLLRFFDPRGGQVLLGGRDLRSLPLADLRRQVAVVSQETYLFHGTVRENLRFGAPGAGAEALDAATRAAGAYDFIHRLPQGYDTLVGERGLTLSGGERQRIAIARALLKDAPILILDEATSSVDSANEAEIQAALDRLAADRTTLVIAHRLSAVRGADRIMLLERGRVADAGTHTQLLERSVGYARLVAAQEHTP